MPLCLWAQVENILPGNIYSSHFTIDERGRDISYYIPVTYSANEHPLVLILPDNNEALQTILKNYAEILHAKADSTASIIMYLQPFSGQWHWADSSGITTVNDAGFISIMVDYFVQQHKCNPKKIYVIGFGNGGKMSCRLSCELRTGIAAAANISTGNDAIICNCKNAVNTIYIDTKKLKKLPGKKIISNNDLALLFDELIQN